MSDPKYLEKFTGEYNLEGQNVTFSLKGKILTCVVPGQRSMTWNHIKIMSLK